MFMDVMSSDEGLCTKLLYYVQYIYLPVIINNVLNKLIQLYKTSHSETFIVIFI